MSHIVVSPVSSRREQRQFIKLPWTLYHGDPNWVPPLIDSQRELLGYKYHPFHDNAEVQTFLARRGNDVVGRVAAILNHAHNRYYKENRGFFGYFESVDDQHVASALLDTVRDWLAERGVTDIRGPANPSTNNECGLLIEGFDSPPVFMMTYNPPYYQRLVEGYGFRKTQDLLAFKGELRQLPDVRAKLKPVLDKIIEHTGCKVRKTDTRRFMQDVELFLSMYNTSLYAAWGFVPFPQKEIRHMAKSLKWLIVPEYGVIAEVDGKPVGVVLAIPDYNPRIKQIDGKLFPFGFVRLLWNKKKIKRIRVICINVIPEFQMWGLGLALTGALVPISLENGVEEAEFSWVAESNTLPLQGLRKGGAVHYKTYRMYDYPPPGEGKTQDESRAAQG